MRGPSCAIVHATCVALSGHGALVRGPSGSGKSDLALRFLFLPPLHGFGQAALIADDQVCLSRDEAGGGLIATCPQAIRGRIEVRGLGILPAPATAPQARIRLLVDLVGQDDVPRFPETLPREEILGCAIPLLALDPFTASAALKLALAIHLVLKADVQ